ncbi:hypothetical protein [Nostocoides japonicum]|nr:hypothetical protein [Tetrasphaera japonica]
MYHRRVQQLRRLEHNRVQHQRRAERQEQMLRHELQMHLARMTR